MVATFVVISILFRIRPSVSWRAGPPPLEFIDEDIGVDVRDVIGVPDVVGEDVQVEVRLPVRRFKPAEEHPPQETGPDLPADRLEERTFPGREGPAVPAPDEECPKDLRLSGERDAGECRKPCLPEEGGGIAVPSPLKVAGTAGPELTGCSLPAQGSHRDVPPAIGVRRPARHRGSR